MKRLSEFVSIKKLQYVTLLCCALLPWKATAVNQSQFSNTFLNLISPPAHGHNHQDLVEDLLVQALIEVTQGNTKQAMQTVNELISKAPNFKLAYLIRGDLLTAKTRPIEGFGNSKALADNQPILDEIEGLREEARTRVAYYFSEDRHQQIPNIPIQLSPLQQHVIVVDTAKSRLFLYQSTAQGLQYVADYYVTIGKNGADKKAQGDKRTPLGVYFAGKKITAKLADLYGDAAYPLDYPNELDQNKKKSGNGIWLHGTPHDTYSRPPRASDGCVVLSNPDIQALAPYLNAGDTPVIITDHIDWVNNRQFNQVDQQLVQLHQAMESWRSDWASQNTERYLSHYSRQFFYDAGNIEQWSANKKRIQTAKSKVRIGINNVSMLGYPVLRPSSTIGSPGNATIVVVDFDQHFKNAQLESTMRKRQYWQLEHNQWKIIYEGTAT